MTQIPDSGHAFHHRDAAELAAGLPDVLASPQGQGPVALLVRRPAPGKREMLDSVELSITEGVVGDDWAARGSRSTPDGGPDPDSQVTLMNIRLARLVAVTDDRVPLAGDQIYVDLDLSIDALPAGTRLAVGAAVIEVTTKPHLPCDLFANRFGRAAARFVNTPEHRALRLRGAAARVIEPGTVRVGDYARVLG